MARRNLTSSGARARARRSAVATEGTPAWERIDGNAPAPCAQQQTWTRADRVRAPRACSTPRHRRRRNIQGRAALREGPRSGRAGGRGSRERGQPDVAHYGLTPCRKWLLGARLHPRDGPCARHVIHRARWEGPHKYALSPVDHRLARAASELRVRSGVGASGWASAGALTGPSRAERAARGLLGERARARW